MKNRKPDQWWKYGYRVVQNGFKFKLKNGKEVIKLQVYQFVQVKQASTGDLSIFINLWMDIVINSTTNTIAHVEYDLGKDLLGLWHQERVKKYIENQVCSWYIG